MDLERKSHRRGFVSSKAMFEPKTCLVAAPIGELASPTRERSDCVVDRIIRPAVEPLGFAAIRLDRVHIPGRVSSQTVLGSIGADLMIADLTGGNPNVLYEVGIRHTVGRPCVQVIETGESVPFDVADIRTLVIDSSSPSGIERAVSDLTNYVIAAMAAPTTRDDIALLKLLQSAGLYTWLTNPLRSDPAGGLPIPTLIRSEMQGSIAKDLNDIHPPRWTKLDHLRNRVDRIDGLQAHRADEEARQAA